MIIFRKWEDHPKAFGRSGEVGANIEKCIQNADEKPSFIITKEVKLYWWAIAASAKMECIIIPQVQN